MSVFYPVIGAPEEPVSLRPADTIPNDLVSLHQTEVVTVVGFIIVNEDVSAHTVSVWYTLDTDVLIYTGSIAAGTTVNDILKAPLRLYGKFGGRKIKVQADVADKVTFTAIVASINDQASA